MSNWIESTIGDLFDVVGGGTPSTEKTEYWNGPIPWITSADIDEHSRITPRKAISEKAVKDSATSKVPAGSVVVVTRVGLGKVGIAETELCFSQDCQGLLFDQENLDPKFVTHQLARATKRFHEVSRGTTISGVTKKQLLSTPFFVAPRGEQKRVVDKLEELLSDLEAGAAALERARANLKRYRAAVLKAAVEGRLTEKWRAAHPDAEPAGKLLERILAERGKKWEEAQLKKYAEKGQTPPKGWKDKYVEPVKPNVASLPELPRSWLWSSLGQCFPVVVGSTPSRSNSRYWHGDVNWVSSGEVQFSRISEAKEKITAEGLANSSTRINPKGSVLLGMIGEGKTRGQAAILDIAAANNQNCAAIWVSETKVLPEFVYFWLWSRYEITRSGGSGNNQPALNKSLVEMIPFPLPPIEEQQEIVLEIDKCCSNLEHNVTALEVMGVRSNHLRQSILRLAFEGRLVPQDPKDEPASELLARIRKEREEVGRGGGQRRKGRKGPPR